MNGLTLFVIITVLIAYIVIGGVVFHFLEEGSEGDYQALVLRARDILLANNTCMTAEELNTFVIILQTSYDAGVSLSNNETSPSNWDMHSAIFFATTVVTTIGYGNIAPATSGGKMFCVLYALFGIPLFLVVTSLLAEKMKILLKSFYNRGTTIDSGIVWNRTMRIASILLSTVLFVFMPSLIFHYIEDDWSYLNSMYYSFITLTTIGFGDYVAGTDVDSMARGWYRIFVALWILMGLAWMGTIITITQEAIAKSFQKKEDKITALRNKHKSTAIDVPSSKGRVTPLENDELSNKKMSDITL